MLGEKKAYLLDGVADYGYTDALHAISRTPVSMVIIELDYCREAFGVAPCAGAGVSCFNTFKTCKDFEHYNLRSKQYCFINTDVGSLFKTGERPYLVDINYLPTEIKTSFTVTGRVKLTMLDEPDTDVGIDPYFATRTQPIAGTFWKKLLARNPNYQGRNIYIYEGFAGIPISEFKLRWKGLLYNISLGRGQVTIEATDPLKSIKDICLPDRVELSFRAGIDQLSTSLSILKSSNISTYSYMRVDDEIVQVHSYNSALDTVYVTRGALNSVATTHDDGAKGSAVWVRGAENPFVTMQFLLSHAGVPSTSINTTAFSVATTWPITDPDVYCIVTEPTPVEQLYFELCELTNCKSWYNEGQKITIQRYILNDPNSSYIDISDNYNILQNTASVDLQAQEYYTRCAMYWGKDAIGVDEDSTSYKYLTIAIDADAESSYFYDKVSEKTIYCRWLSDTAISIEDAQQNAYSYSGRFVFNNRDPKKILTCDLELNDSTIIIGSRVNITTDETQDIYGDPAEMKSIVIRREMKANGNIGIKCQALPERYIMLMAATSAGDWTASSSAARIANGYLANQTGYMPDGGTPGYSMY